MKKSPDVSKNTVKNESAKMSAKIMPLGDRVLLKPIPVDEVEKRNMFGIIVPDTVSKEAPERGKVLAVGEGRYDNGKYVPLRVKAGDIVIFSKYGYDEVKSGDDKLYILKEDGILAIIK